MRISIVGAGYVGLVTGAGLAGQGHSVVCVDVDRQKVAALSEGRCPIFEEGLPELIARCCAEGRLTATLDLTRAVHETELTLIAAPTPFGGEVIDLGPIRQVARELGAALKTKDGYHVVVVKSTVVPGTTDEVVGPLVAEASGRRPGEGFGLGMNPEFLSEGVALADFTSPDRIVLGGIDARTQDALAELYAGFSGVPLLRTNNRTAEMIKYASNALQATMISFSNEIAELCEAAGGVDAVDVLRGVHAMKELTVSTHGERVPAPITRFLLPGCGFGGSCFPKDLKALAAFGRGLGRKPPLLEAVLGINAGRARALVDAAERSLGGLEGKPVAVLGLAFKAGTDDVRESPALELVRLLQARGAKVTAHDPVARETAGRALSERPPRWAESLEAAVEGAELLVVATAWPEYARLPALLAHRSPPPLVVDGRRMFRPGELPRYLGVGLRP